MQHEEGRQKASRVYLARTGLRCSMATLSMRAMKLGAVMPLNFPIVRCKTEFRC